MTLISPPAFQQAGTYTALMDRLTLNTARTLKDPASGGVESLGGFFPDRFVNYANPSGMDWTLGPCAGVIANDFATDAGEYVFVNTSNINGTFAAASPTLNRHDILGFRVHDNFYDASGFNQVTAVVLQGANSAGAPSDPSIPSSFIPVVRAVINAGVTSPTLQDLRVRTTLSGGVLPIPTAAYRTALGTQYHGMSIWRTDTLNLEVANGAGGWRVPTVPVAADAAALTAAVTSPYEGQLAYRLDTGRYYRRWGSAWLPAAGILHAYQSSAGLQNILNNTPTALTFNAEIRDDYNGHSTSVNPSRYTPPVPGTYKCFGMVSYDGVCSGPFMCQFRKNGAVSLNANYEGQHAVNQIHVANCASSEATFDMNGTTDYIELWTYHVFAATRSTFSNATDQASHMIIERVM